MKPQRLDRRYLVVARTLRITHRPTGAVIAEGPRGWGITPFEGNLYIQSRYLKEGHFRVSWIPGICFYKFLYFWLNWESPTGAVSRFLGWRYIVPNPLFPFIWFRVGVPQSHTELLVEELPPHQSN